MTNRPAARVTSDPAIMMGKLVIKGTRIPVELILRHLGAGDSEQQILADYPCLTIEDIWAAQASKNSMNQEFQQTCNGRYQMNIYTHTLVLSVALLGGCAPALDLSPLHKTSASDSQWIKDFDKELMEEQERVQNAHTGSINSQIILWEDLNCMRGTYIAQARAAQAIAESGGIPIAEAMNVTRADPAWTIALQGCE